MEKEIDIIDAVNGLCEDIPKGRCNAITIDELAELWETELKDTVKVISHLIVLGNVQIGFFRE